VLVYQIYHAFLIIHFVRINRNFPDVPLRQLNLRQKMRFSAPRVELAGKREKEREREREKEKEKVDAR